MHAFNLELLENLVELSMGHMNVRMLLVSYWGVRVTKFV